MIAIYELIKRSWLPVAATLAVVALLAAIFFFGYQAGQSDANAEWSLKWSDRDKADALALAKRQADAREEENRRQREADENRNQAVQQISAAKADADNARADADGLHDKAEKLARRLAERERSCNSITSGGSKTNAGGAAVLSELFRRADERAGELAAALDDARIRGMSCESAYDSLTKK